MTWTSEGVGVQMPATVTRLGLYWITEKDCCRGIRKRVRFLAQIVSIPKTTPVTPF